MRLIRRGALLGWLFLGVWCALAKADGGSPRLSATKGAYRLTVFTAPTPLRAGPVDISVLVQDRFTGSIVPGARVTIGVSKRGQPTVEHEATRAAATNKLFHAAQFDLPAAGRWELQVRIDGSEETVVIGGPLEAAGPLPRWPQTWPWVAWPAVPIVLFVVHQVLVRRRMRTASAPP
jgi:hypothetical protein